MQINIIIRSSIGADGAVSKNQTDDESSPFTVTPPRSEGSVALGREMLRGVYPERSESAQHDRAITHTDA